MAGFEAPVLEPFTVGADVNPLSNDPKWALLSGVGGTTLRIESTIGSGGAVVNNTNGNDALYYYTPLAATEADYEVRFNALSHNTTGGTQREGCFVRASGSGSTWNGYWLLLSGTNAVALFKFVAGVGTGIGSATRTITSGEDYCLRCSGSALEVWVRSGGVDTMLIDVTDSTYASGLGGISVRGTSPGLDNFGWAPITPQIIEYRT